MTYKKVIELNIQHDYFDQGFFSGLQIDPSLNCKKILHNFGIHIKKSENGFSVLWDTENRAFSSLKQKEKKELKLTFYLNILDPLFLNYSELNVSSLNGVFRFSNMSNEEGALIMHRNEQADESDFISITGSTFSYAIIEEDSGVFFELYNEYEELLETIHIQENQTSIKVSLAEYENGIFILKNDKKVVAQFYKDPNLAWKPVFGVIEIYPFEESTDITGQLTNDGITEPVVLKIYVGARSTIWRYYVISKYSSSVENASISNGRSEQEMSFINKGNHSLPDGSEALVFDSESTILLQEIPSVKYQLKSDTGKILVKTLPTPSVNFINTKKENDQQHFYSEMFVYL